MPVLQRTILCTTVLASLAAQEPFLVDVTPAGRGAAVADIDGDGLVDLLSVQDTQLVLYRNAGSGRYAEPLVISPPGLRLSWRVGVADFDGDGDADVVAIEEYDSGTPGNDVYLLTQQNLTFTSTVIGQLATQFSVAPNFVHVMDLENDGDQDVVASGYGAPLTSQIVLRNNGGGGFTDVTAQWALPFNGITALELDVDGDGLQDLFCVSALQGTRVIRSTGTGFVDETAARITGLYYCNDAVAGDVDGDGDADVLTVGTLGGDLLLNQGGMLVSASTAVFPATPAGVVAPALVDVDGDGDLDACVVDHSTGQFTFLHNNGAGTFAAPVSGPTVTPDGGNPTLVAFDHDRDGDQDLLFFDRRVALLIGDGVGNFTEREVSQTVIQHAGFAVDLDGDGDRDLLGSSSFAFYEQNNRWREVSTGSLPLQPASLDQIGDIDGDGDLDILTDDVYRNNGAGSFSVGPASGLPSPLNGSAAFADFDLDGDLDVALLSGGLTNAQVVIYSNNGTGTFTAGATIAAPGAIRCQVAHVDADRRPDVVLVRLLNGSEALRNTSGGWVSRPLPAGILIDPEFAQFGGSAEPDLLLHGTTLRVYRWQGGSYVDVTAAVLPSVISRGTVGDYDDDGDLDIVGTSLLTNDGTGGFTQRPIALREAPASLADVDGDGDLDALSTTGVNWSRERHVEVQAAPKIGRSLELLISSRPGRALGDFAVLGMAFTSRPVGLQSPFGLLFVDQPRTTLFLPLPNGSGEQGLSLPIPNNQGLIGLEVHLQTLHGNASWVALGNLAITTVE